MQAVSFELGIRSSENNLCRSTHFTHEAHVGDLDRFWETIASTVGTCGGF